MTGTDQQNADPPHRTSWLQRVVYFLVWRSALAIGTIFFRARRFHVERIPTRGPVLLAANHQSHLDPPLVSFCCTSRPTHFLARAGLFKNRLFGWFITALNSVPIKEDSGDLHAMRQILARLESGAAVIIFPEGARSPDGAMHPFKRGVTLLLKRARCPVVPIAVEGCFDAFPRHTSLPRLFGPPIAAMVGQPIEPDDLLAHGPEEALHRLEREIDAMRLQLRARLRASSGGRYPAPGPGDQPFSPRPAVP